MSWFNDLAGKAESLLNNIDKSTAEAISVNNSLNVSHSSDVTNHSYANDDQDNVVTQHNQSAPTLNVKPFPSSTKIQQKKFNKTKKQQVQPKTSDADDKLFEFLNSKDSTKQQQQQAKKKEKIKTPPLPMANEMNRNIIVSDERRKSDAPSSSNSSDFQDLTSDQDLFTLPMTSQQQQQTATDHNSTESESDFELINNNHTSPQEAPSASMKSENQLLRSEIVAMHQEMSQSRDRYKRQLQDMQKTNENLRSRYDEVNRKVELKDEENNKLQNQLNNLKEEKQHLLKEQISKVQEERQKNEEKQLLGERQGFIESLQKFEQDLTSEKKKCDLLTKEIGNLKSELKLTKQESNEYKQKATRILQSKERLISSLKSGGDDMMTSSHLSQMEADDMKEENEFLQEEVAQLKSNKILLETHLQQLETETREEREEMEEENCKLKFELDEQQKLMKEQQADICRLNEDERRRNEEALNQKTNLRLKMEEKENEIEKLRKQLLLRAQNSPQEAELESRLRQLTENLIHKQSVIERLSTEKNSFQLQKERMEGQIKRLSEESGKHVSIRMDHHEKSSPTHHNQPPHNYYVNQAVSVVDKFSIRLGIFLRRYPSARLLVLFYMIMLHVWTMFVLFTYSPETHDSDEIFFLQHQQKH